MKRLIMNSLYKNELTRGNSWHSVHETIHYRAHTATQPSLDSSAYHWKIQQGNWLFNQSKAEYHLYNLLLFDLSTIRPKIFITAKIITPTSKSKNFEHPGKASRVSDALSLQVKYPSILCMYTVSCGNLILDC